MMRFTFRSHFVYIILFLYMLHTHFHVSQISLFDAKANSIQLVMEVNRKREQNYSDVSLRDVEC